MLTPENGSILPDPKSILEKETNFNKNIYQFKQTDSENIAFARFWNLKDFPFSIMLTLTNAKDT